MNPLAEYQARLEERRRASQHLERQFRRIGNARLAAGFAAVVVAFFVFGEVWISVWWLLLPVAVFASLVVLHARVVERLERSKRAVQFYERGLARLEDRWMGLREPGTGEAGERFRDPDHLYSEDLDLFGKGSLFELLSTARTRAGEDSLAALAAGARIPGRSGRPPRSRSGASAAARSARGSGRAGRYSPLRPRSGRRGCAGAKRRRSDSRPERVISRPCSPPPW